MSTKQFPRAIPILMGFWGRFAARTYWLVCLAETSVLGAKVGKPAQKDESAQTVDAQTFGSTMGNAVWLMTMDKTYRDRPIREIEALVATPILLRQFKLYSKDNQPVAFLTWASVSDAVKAKVEAGETLALEDWRSGENLMVVDVVSPFSPTEGVRKRFLQDVEARS